MVINIQSVIIIIVGIIINILLLKYITGTLYREDKMIGRQGIGGLKGIKGLYGTPGELGERGPSGNPGPIGGTGHQGILGKQGIIYKYGTRDSSNSGSSNADWWEEHSDSTNDNKFYNMINTIKQVKKKPCVQCPGWDPLPHWSVNGYCGSASNCILNR
jgi:hypothetical protein